jgi:hypothetical protein
MASPPRPSSSWSRCAALLQAASLGALLLAGCSRFSDRASSAECQKACDRVSLLETERLKGGLGVQLHELDEHLEAAEDDLKAALKQLDSEEAAGPYKLDQKVLAGLSKARRDSIVLAHKLREEALVVQRKQARVNAHRVYEEAKSLYETTKADNEKTVAKAVADSVGRCTPACLAGPLARALCLQRAQALEDLALCNR